LGLDAARCLTDKPVIGIGEAAYHMASMISNKFSVVTTLARSVPALEHNLHRCGLMARCARVRSSEVAVLELEHPGSDACNRISAEIGRAVAEDRAEAIVLGCAGMADLAAALSRNHGLPVPDGVTCAIGLAETMVRLRLPRRRLCPTTGPQAVMGRGKGRCAVAHPTRPTRRSPRRLLLLFRPWRTATGLRG
jgi:allantoin racemase